MGEDIPKVDVAERGGKGPDGEVLTLDRRLFAQLDAARNEQHQLDIDYKRLDAERQAQATHLRVEKMAREKLRMRTATPAVTHYVAEAASAAASAAVAASAASTATRPAGAGAP